MVSNARDDLPDPERPVMTVSRSRGIETSRFLRLCSRAPRMIRASSAIACESWPIGRGETSRGVAALCYGNLSIPRHAPHRRHRCPDHGRLRRGGGPPGARTARPAPDRLRHAGAGCPIAVPLAGQDRRRARGRADPQDALGAAGDAAGGLRRIASRTRSPSFWRSRCPPACRSIWTGSAARRPWPWPES